MNAGNDSVIASQLLVIRSFFINRGGNSMKYKDFNPCQLLRAYFIKKVVDSEKLESVDISKKNVDGVYKALDVDHVICNFIDGEPTDLNFEIDLANRRWLLGFEIEWLAVEFDGRWLVFPHLFGGGRHSEPEQLDFTKYAHFVACSTKTVEINVFSELTK